MRIFRASIWLSIAVSAMIGVFAPSPSFAADDALLQQQARQQLVQMKDVPQQAFVTSLQSSPVPNTPFPGAFDLSNAKEYQYLLSALTAAGITQSNYPALYQALATANQSLYPKANQNGINIPTTVQQAEGSGLQTVNVIAYPAPSGQKYIPLYGTTSVPGKPIAFGNVIYATRSNGDVTPVVGSIQVSGQAGAVTNSVQVPMPSADTIDNGNLAYVVVYPASILPASVQSKLGVSGNDPIAIAGASLAFLTDLNNMTFNVTAPVDVNGDGIITVCIVRTGTNCDYSYGQYQGQWVLQFPLEGNIGYPQNVAFNSNNTPTNGTYSIYFYYSATGAKDGYVFGEGGGCQMTMTSALPWTSGGAQVVKWSATGANSALFGQPCWTYGAMVPLEFVMTLNVYTAATPQQLMTGTISNIKPPAPGVYLIDPIQAVYGCLAADSQVTLSDGTKRPIDKVDVGTKVKSEGGQTLTVQNWKTGPSEQLYYVTTRNKRTLGLTQGHAVPTNRGIVIAKDLKVGDVLTTDAGKSAIATITQRSYSGKVWNLDVGGKGDTVALTDTNRTFFANGILVGDGWMQNRETQRVASGLQLRASNIPAGWMTDFLSAERLRSERLSATVPH